jgi:hypothetical protein
MLDIGGYLTSREFLTQFAAFVSAVLSALFGILIGDFFGVM